MTGYGFFDNIFGTKTTMTNSPESPVIKLTNGNVTYQGVLDMLNKIRFVIQSPYVPNRRTCDVLCREIYNNTCILAQRMWEVNNSNQSINIIVGCGDTEIDRFAYNCVCAKPLY
jgi:hypothetical protein